MSNAFQVRDEYSGMMKSDSCNLFLDGLQYSVKELEQLKALVISYDRQDRVHQLHLQDNGLTDVSINILQELMATMPYLKILDLRKNQISDLGMQTLKGWLSNQAGVTEVTRDMAEIRARSGNQVGGGAPQKFYQSLLKGASRGGLVSSHSVCRFSQVVLVDRIRFLTSSHSFHQSA